MTKSSAPPRSAGSDDFQIEIDPSLIEEALAAVSRRLGPELGTETPEGIDIEVELEGASEAPVEAPVDAPVEAPVEAPVHAQAEAPAEAPPQPDETRIQAEQNEQERRRLLVRTREQAERIKRLDLELARANEAREGFERQTRELRKAHTELSADFDRYRVRARKDAEEAERRGEDRGLRPIVDVYDNVERAWLHAVSDPTQILSGLQIIVEQFKRLLTRLGFERIDADRGATFDPAWHEAVLHVASDELPPGLVVDEVHAGFKLRGRLFRAARVTVSAPVEPLG